MAKKKAAITNSENTIQVLKTGTCPTTSGKSTLGYQVGVDETGVIHLKVASNDGGGFFSNEWVSFADIQQAITEWPEDQPLTSMTFRKIFRGKSANTPGFLVAVLCVEGILEPVGEKKRVHQACDPAAFIASVAALQGKPAKQPKAKAAPQKKATPKATAKSPRKSPANTGNTSSARSSKSARKSPARSKRAS